MLDFRSEKHCREETIGAACDIAELAKQERRELTRDERQRVDALLSTAQMTLGLDEIPRERDKLIAYSHRVTEPRRLPSLEQPLTRGKRLMSWLQ
jgi:hypothetical protein